MVGGGTIANVGGCSDSWRVDLFLEEFAERLRARRLEGADGNGCSTLPSLRRIRRPSRRIEGKPRGIIERAQQQDVVAVDHGGVRSAFVLGPYGPTVEGVQRVPSCRHVGETA